MGAVVRLELVQLWRSWTVRLGLLALFVAGGIGIWHGHATIERQRAAITEAPALQAEQHRAIFDPIASTARAGDQLYYLFFRTAHEPTALASLAIGQRDAQPFSLRVRLLALEGQLYDSELANPLLATLGPFDVALVVALLAPLFVIALMHNLWSAEEEWGTARLIRSQPVSPWVVAVTKLFARAGVAAAPFYLVFALATWALAIPIDDAWGLVLVLITAYVVVWVGVAALVAAIGRSSEFNVVTLLGVWVVWAIVGPALLSVGASVRYPAPEALELTVRQRQAVHSAWDAPLVETMGNFYRSYPEWRDVPVPTGAYSNGWYYAMQQRGDDEAREASEAYREALTGRHEWTRRAAVLLPPALLQSALTGVARTDIASHLAYQQSVRDYHEALKRYFLPAIFLNHSIAEVDWTAAPVHDYQPAADHRPIWRQALALAGQGLVLLLLGVLALGRRVRAFNGRA
jgi:ABC-2 type transport system permease protein